MVKRVVNFSMIGSPGIIRDMSPTEIPAEPGRFAWSDGLNVQFTDGKAQKVYGELSVLTLTAAPSVPLRYVFGPEGQGFGSYYVAGVTADSVFLIGAAGSNLLTGMPFGANAAGGNAAYGITNCIMNKRGIVSDGGDNDPSVLFGAPWTTLNYDATPSWLSVGASVDEYRLYGIRRFKNYLIGLGFRDPAYGAGSFQNVPRGIWWSTDAASTALPTTWDYTDTTERAGQRVFDESGGDVVDGFQLRDQFLVYQEFKVQALQEVGGRAVFRRYELFNHIGVLGRKCVAQLEDEHVGFA